MIHARDRGELHARAAEERLVGERDWCTIERSVTGTPIRSRRSSMIVRRVTPSRALSVTGGVTTAPFFTRKKFSAEPSETCPSWVSTIASSKPARCASVLAKAEFT
jgi:hypothetical protein